MSLPTVTSFTANTAISSSEMNTNLSNLRLRTDIAPTTADHITLTAGTSKLVRITTLRQADTSNTYTPNVVLLHGWGAITGSAATAIAEGVTFGITFTSTPDVYATFMGRNDTADSYPPDEAATDIAGGSAVTPTTTGFTVAIHNYAGTNLDAAKKYYYCWIAIGVYS